MHVPLSDNITTGDREAASERSPTAPVEREVQLEGAPVPEEVIRARIERGFYQTSAVADFVARQIVTSGDF